MSEYKEYITFSKSEQLLLMKSIIIFSILYTFQAVMFSSLQWYQVLIPVVLWYCIYTLGFLTFHKLCAYKQAFTIKFKELEFDQYHLEYPSALTKQGVKIGFFDKTTKKPIKFSIFSIIIAILTIGFVIIPGIFTYTHRKIDHLFFGKIKMFEQNQGNLYPQENTGIRQSYAFFFTNLYPLLWIVIFSAFKDIYIIQILLIITIIHAFLNLFPLFPNLGYRYFSMHFYLWSTNFTMLLIFSLFALFFTSFTAFLTVSLCASAIFISIYFVRFTNSA